MKVSSAPFEAPIGSSDRGTASDGALRGAPEKSSIHLVSSPAANSNLKAGLDAATKDALLRLANLAREKEKEQESEKEGEKRKSEDGSSEAKSKVVSAGEALSIEAIQEFSPAVLAIRSSETSQNALSRMRLRFEAARRTTGRQVYREAVKRQSIVELEKQFNLDLNVDDLESVRDVELLKDSGKLESLKFSGVGLKRVA